MNKIGKVWGLTSSIFNKNNVEIHRLEIQKGGYSSKHKHAHKYNLFYVESGELEISIWKNDYDLKDVTILHSNDSCIISPNEFHMFKANEDTICYEIYWVEISEGDIVRDNCGGKDAMGKRQLLVDENIFDEKSTGILHA